MKEYFAHSLPDRPTTEWQPLEEHLQNAAKMAAEFAERFNAGEWAYYAGLWHDLGKYSKEFQEGVLNINDPDVHIETTGARVDHSTAGARHAVTALDRKRGWILAYAIAGHHAGLTTGISNDRSCLKKRLENKNIPDSNAAPSEILKAEQLPAPGLSDHYPGFQLSLFIRMIYSCLVDADFLDTETFMDPHRNLWRSGYPTLDSLQQKLKEHLANLKEKAGYSTINSYRNEVLLHCLNTAKSPPGIFSLTVPTGGGKTLSSLAFALDHALEHDLERIIYVIPYTSIIEQTAGVFREILGEDAVLEHHSNFEPKKEDMRSRLASENWDAPIIVTTNIQLFESLFAHKSSRTRKIHNISKSVVILDEAQMLPVSLLTPSLETIRYLVTQYGCTIVLCTATQPALSSTETFEDGLDNVHEIIPDPGEMYERMKRVHIEFLGKLKDEQLATHLSDYSQVLCIVNTRRHARILYEMLDHQAACYHLSANMCPEHRSEVLASIKNRLLENEPCRVISTQLVEAGVDIDFPVVFRAIAGIDSIAQAAGRCNREGKTKAGGTVYVFTSDSLPPPGHLRQTAQLAERLASDWQNILSLETIHDYFRELYWMKDLDKKKIMQMLDGNSEWQRLNFDFPEIDRRFRIIEESGESLIIRYNNKAEGRIKELMYSDSPAAIIRKLQRFTIQVHTQIIRELEISGCVYRIHNTYPVLEKHDLYDKKLGLCPENPLHCAPESLIV